MAKTRRRRGGENLMGYFRQIYQENPKLLKGKSNDEIMSRWEDDHPKHTPLEKKRARQSVANLKSTLRRKRRRRGKRMVETTSAPSAGARVSTAYTNSYSSGNPELESLEEHIDDCILQARQMDRGGLEEVIRHLRRARVEVSQMIG
jgi:hypothetical protein